MHSRFSRRAASSILVALAAVTLSADGRLPLGIRHIAVRQHSPIRIHDARDTAVQSTNWSGYAVTDPAGSVTDVVGAWTVPAIQNACSSTNEYSSFWVGIDGFNSGTVEQTGTDSDCQNGSPVYYAWYEFYPKPSFAVLIVNPGDIISAHVHYDGSRRFTVSLTDQTTGQSFTTTASVRSAKRTSAEWIAEAPSSAGGVLPLADFGTVSFTSDDATIAGATTAIGKFPVANQYQITMVNEAGTANKAVPSSLGPDNSSFSVAWASAGP